MSEWNEAKDSAPVRDDGVEQVLGALGAVALPEGLDARITAAVRMRLAAGERQPFHWWDAVRGGGPAAGIWWRGLLSGAAGAMVCMGAVLAVQHGMQRRATRSGAPVSTVAQAPRSVPTLAALPLQPHVPGQPCSPFGEARQTKTARAVGAGRLRLVSTEGVPIGVPQTSGGSGLTAQERELLVLARTADPVVQASLNQELRAKAEAEDAAQFESFFFHPPVQINTERDNN